ncbi:hypothetical protein [Streptomyces turgidiscabies]|uniref:hypothetical protein n=1 Tax=Streptomyces turgidiscabies TaxID=85558 RepID=UPI0038F67AA8
MAAARKQADDAAVAEPTETVDPEPTGPLVDPADPESEETPDEQPNAAVVAPRQYQGGSGWAVGQNAPEDAYRALGGEDHATPVGPVVHTHPGGFARLIAARGGLITDGVKRELEAGDKSAEGEQG